jgi:hypothetical protein
VIEFEQFIQQVDAAMADPRRQEPGRQAGIDQWLAGFNARRDRLIIAVRHIQERGDLSRGDYIDTVVTAMMMTDPRIEELAALFAALTWELGLLVDELSR